MKTVMTSPKQIMEIKFQEPVEINNFIHSIKYKFYFVSTFLFLFFIKTGVPSVPSVPLYIKTETLDFDFRLDISKLEEKHLNLFYLDKLVKLKSSFFIEIFLNIFFAFLDNFSKDFFINFYITRIDCCF